MSPISGPVNIAILDDYQNVALEMADWSALDGRASITIFNDHLADPDRMVERLLPFDVLLHHARANAVATGDSGALAASEADRFDRLSQCRDRRRCRH